VRGCPVLVKEQGSIEVLQISESLRERNCCCSSGKKRLQEQIKIFWTPPIHRGFLKHGGIQQLLPFPTEAGQQKSLKKTQGV